MSKPVTDWTLPRSVIWGFETLEEAARRVPELNRALSEARNNIVELRTQLHEISGASETAYRQIQWRLNGLDNE